MKRKIVENKGNRKKKKRNEEGGEKKKRENMERNIKEKFTTILYIICNVLMLYGSLKHVTQV